MNLSRLIQCEQAQFLDNKLLCGGGGGPSSGSLIAQEKAAQARAQAETDKIKAQRDADKALESAKNVTDQAAMVNADAARRAKNRTLLAGLSEEEGLTGLKDIEDPDKASSRKAKRATLIGSMGGGI